MVWAGKPTFYDGVEMRSMLEATWAVFFDLVGWKWEYEPACDFWGWIPDFALFGKTEIVYVEIKPISLWTPWVVEKIEASGCKEEVLILGLSPKILWDDTYLAPIGWLSERSSGGLTGELVKDDDGYQVEINEEFSSGFWWEKAQTGFWNDNPRSLDFCHELGTFRGRLLGGYDGGSYGDNPNRLSTKEWIAERWGLAKNTIKWKPGR